MKASVRISSITIVFTSLFLYIFFYHWSAIRNGVPARNETLQYVVSYFILSIPLLVGVLLAHRFTNLAERTGLNKSVIEGAVFAGIATLPMFVGYALRYHFNARLDAKSIVVYIFCAGFFEELWFRAVLFGQLYRYTKLGFVSATLIGSTLFACTHLYQAHSLADTLMILLTTFFGSLLFSWLYVEWKFNLWVPILLHIGMNTAWIIFSISNDAVGSMYANVFRVATILLVILITVVYKKRRHQPMAVTLKNLFIKPAYE